MPRTQSDRAATPAQRLHTAVQTAFGRGNRRSIVQGLNRPWRKKKSPTMAPTTDRPAAICQPERIDHVHLYGDVVERLAAVGEGFGDVFECQRDRTVASFVPMVGRVG